MSDAPPRQRMRMSILQAYGFFKSSILSVVFWPSWPSSDIVRVGHKIDALSICKASPLSELEQVINILPRCKSLIEDSEKNTNCREYVQDAHLSMTIQDRKALNRWMEHFPETKQEALHLLMLERWFMSSCLAPLPCLDILHPACLWRLSSVKFQFCRSLRLLVTCYKLQSLDCSISISYVVTGMASRVPWYGGTWFIGVGISWELN